MERHPRSRFDLHTQVAEAWVVGQFFRKPLLARLPVIDPRHFLPPVVLDDSGPVSKEPRVVGLHASDAVTAFCDHAMEERALPPRPEESIAKQYRGVVRGPEACPTHRGRRIVV